MASPVVDRRLLTLEQAAHYLGQTVRWLRRHMASTTERTHEKLDDDPKGERSGRLLKVNKGDIPVVRTGKSVRFRVADLDAWIEANTVYPDGHPSAKPKTKAKKKRVA